MRTLIISTLIAVIAASPAGGQERSAEEGGATVEKVFFNDLDLKTTAGLRQLRRRIATATEAVCDNYAGKEQYEIDRITRCRQEVARAVEPQLARVMRRNDAQLAVAVSR